MGFVGLVPSEYSTGKNSHARPPHQSGQRPPTGPARRVGLELSASALCRPRDRRPPQRARTRGSSSSLGCTAPALRSISSLSGAQEHQERGGGRDCERARRVPLGRDGCVTMTFLDGHSGWLAQVTESWTMRRRPAVAGPIPGGTMPRQRRCEASQGHLPADSRHAVPIREHQCGGQPIHQPPAHRRVLGARPPPVIWRGGRVAAATPASRPFVLATLRALRLDSEAPSPAHL